MAAIIQTILSLDLTKWIGAVTALLGAVIAFFMLIPGEQPEKALQGILDFLAKFSKK